MGRTKLFTSKAEGVGASRGRRDCRGIGTEGLALVKGAHELYITVGFEHMFLSDLELTFKMIIDVQRLLCTDLTIF